MRFRLMLAVAAFALAGCSASQEVNPSSRTDPGVVAGPDFARYNEYDPTKYAQTSGFYSGSSGGRLKRARLRYLARSIQLSANKCHLALINASKIASVY